MSDSIFQPGGPHKIRKTGHDEYSMKVEVPLDEDGMLGSASRLNGLLPKPEAADEGLVSLQIDPLEVVELPPALADELEQATTGVVVLAVRLEVLGEQRNALGEQRNLDLGRARVLVVDAKLVDDLGFLTGVKHDFPP